MKIKTVNIINLKRRADLREQQLKTWTALGYHPDQIVFHDAMDGMEYESRERIAEAALKDGFEFFSRMHSMPPDFWIGVGELACMWSISRLLRHLESADVYPPKNSSRNIYLYVLADRYAKMPKEELESIFNGLPDLKFLQFRGRVPQVEHDWHYREEWRKQPDFVNHSQIPLNTIEHSALKIGDGVLAMTSAGAKWMLKACETHLPGQPYEGALYFATLSKKVKGVYSTYTQADETATSEEYYSSFDTHRWEGQYDYNSKLGFSDIADINQKTGTGEYGNLWGGEHNA